MRITEDFERREVGMIATRLRLLAVDVRLDDGEIERLIGIDAGEWPLGRYATLGISQETRLRHLLEVVERITALFGADAARWLRNRNPSLRTRPIKFMLEEPIALRALRDALRAEMA